MTSVKRRLELVLAAFLLLAGADVLAQTPVKIGAVAEFSGPFADYGAQILGGMKAYLKQNGEVFAGRKIEIVTRDTTARRPTSPSASHRSW